MGAEDGSAALFGEKGMRLLHPPDGVPFVDATSSVELTSMCANQYSGVSSTNDPFPF